LQLNGIAFDGRIAMGSERDSILRRRQELRSEFGAFYDRVSAILFEEDPGGVNFEDNTDEYECEVDRILPLLRSCWNAPRIA
jgi:hypothetical protein